MDKEISDVPEKKRRFKSYKKGGMVYQTGPAMLHKGELVVSKHMMDANHKRWMMSEDGAMKG